MTLDLTLDFLTLDRTLDLTLDFLTLDLTLDFLTSDLTLDLTLEVAYPSTLGPEVISIQALVLDYVSRHSNE